MVRKEKIRQLQIKNSRRLLYEEMKKYIKDIKLENFISLDATLDLQKKIRNLINEMDRQGISIKKTLDNSYIDLVKESLDIFNNYFNDDVVFFHRESIDIGAININVKSVIESIDYILSISTMYRYGCSIYIVDKNMKFGLCLWKSEYDIAIYKW